MVDVYVGREQRRVKKWAMLNLQWFNGEQFFFISIVMVNKLVINKLNP